MNTIALETTEQSYFITIDKSLMDSDTFYAFFERLRTEFLAKKMNTDEADLQALSEEIKESWWKKNQERILKIVSQSPENQY